jgi:hypothetical protein
MKLSSIITIYNAPHPAKLLGKGIEYLIKYERNCISSSISRVVPSNDFLTVLMLEDDDTFTVEDDDDDAKSS